MPDIAGSPGGVIRRSVRIGKMVFSGYADHSMLTIFRLGDCKASLRGLIGKIAVNPETVFADFLRHESYYIHAVAIVEAAYCPAFRAGYFRVDTALRERIPVGNAAAFYFKSSVERNSSAVFHKASII